MKSLWPADYHTSHIEVELMTVLLRRQQQRRRRRRRRQLRRLLYSIHTSMMSLATGNNFAAPTNHEATKTQPRGSHDDNYCAREYHITTTTTTWITTTTAPAMAQPRLQDHCTALVIPFVPIYISIVMYAPIMEKMFSPVKASTHVMSSLSANFMTAWDWVIIYKFFYPSLFS